jgi:hypothetical protein
LSELLPTEESLIAMKNYQFKHSVSQYLETLKDCKQLREFAEKLSEFKKGMILSKLLTSYANGSNC